MNKTIFETDRKEYTADKSNLDTMLDEMWENTLQSREKDNIFAYLKLIYSEDSSPVGVTSLPYDWAKMYIAGKYASMFDALDKNRLDLIVSAYDKKWEPDLDCFLVIEKKDPDNVSIKVNKIYSRVNPAPYYEIINRFAHSETEMKKNVKPYVSQFQANYCVLKHRLNAFINSAKRTMVELKEQIFRPKSE